jgi:CHAT domain-containing protein
VIQNLPLNSSAADLTLLEGSEACPKTVKERREVRSSDILHLSCHGMFPGGGVARAALLDPSQVLESSGLLFDSDETQNTIPPSKLLSMVDIWSLQLAHCRLACVVSCSGGVVNTRSQSDECLSIGTAFLVAGARHVVCTLWPVNQVAAVLVMSRFYQNMCDITNEDANAPWHIARCLAQAQSWYRSLAPEEYNKAFEENKLTDAIPNDDQYRPDN